jgi:hypothetical protein
MPESTIGKNASLDMNIATHAYRPRAVREHFFLIQVLSTDRA